MCPQIIGLALCGNVQSNPSNLHPYVVVKGRAIRQEPWFYPSQDGGVCSYSNVVERCRQDFHVHKHIIHRHDLSCVIVYTIKCNIDMKKSKKATIFITLTKLCSKE